MAGSHDHLAAEGIERAALETLHGAVEPAAARRLGLHLERFGDALLSAASAVPGIVVNRTQGLGLDEPADRETVAAIVARYRALGVARYFVHLHPEALPAQLRSWLEDEGLEEARGWMKFVRDDDAPLPEARSDLEVRQIGGEHAEAFGRIAADGFGLGETGAPLVAALHRAPGWRLYMSFDGGAPAGTGALFVHRGAGWLDWAATAPEHRRRGSQTALLRRRLEDARRAGCRRLYTTTGEAVPGDPQHSYSNILRAGFREDYSRANLAPPRDAAS